MFVVYNSESGWSDESMRFETMAEAEECVTARESRSDDSYAIRVEGWA